MCVFTTCTGILLGMDILSQSTDGMAGGNIIVVSDGEENVAPYIDNITQFVSQICKNIYI